MSPAALAFSGSRNLCQTRRADVARMPEREERGRNRGADATWRTLQERRTRMKKIGQENLGENLGPLEK